MNPIDRKDASRRMTPPKDWNEDADGPCGVLAIADVAGGDGMNWMESLWKPTPEEIDALVAGHPVILMIGGWAHPVVSISVAASPMEGA